MRIVLLVLGFLFAYVILSKFIDKKEYDDELRMLEDDKTPESIKQDIKIKHLEKEDFLKSRRRLYGMKVSNMALLCKLENVYGDFKDSYDNDTFLVIDNDSLSYEMVGINKALPTCFSIPYDKIIDAKCDTSENLTAMRLVTLGVLAFAFKKKTYYTIITYKNDLTNSQDQLIFRVDNPNGKDEFINNLIVKRNQYLINKQEPIA